MTSDRNARMEPSPRNNRTGPPERAPEKGQLYLVATPIGNLGDLSLRAVEILKGVDFIACEDSRHSRPLMDHYGIERPLVSLHEHNEDERAGRLVERLKRGETMALVSDAGTPLINDPGYPLVRLARGEGIPVRPVPGPCALVAALSASGLPSHRFAFEGFPPRKKAARTAFFQALLKDPRTLIFYESSHRISECLDDVAEVFETSRRVVIARELTKRFETILETSASEAPNRVRTQEGMQRGEFVVLIEGFSPDAQADVTDEQLRVLQILLKDHSVKTAVTLTLQIAGGQKDKVYREALRLKS